MSSIPVVAFLGPLGTYTHQATLERFEKVKGQVTFEACGSIKETYDRVKKGEARFGLLPWENSIQGQVKDTYDALQDENGFGKTVLVGGEYTFGIDHCLLVKKGVAMEEITRVMSHEQALGQCKDWLKRHVPKAELVKVASTAGAAKLISSREEAAICSRICVDLYGGLEVIAQGIQDEDNNKTRFMVVLTKNRSQGGEEDDDDRLKIGRSKGVAEGEFRALIRVTVSTKDDNNDNDNNPLMTKLHRILSSAARILRIDRRGNLYFFEIAAGNSSTLSETCAQIDGVLLGQWI